MGDPQRPVASSSVPRDDRHDLTQEIRNPEEAARWIGDMYQLWAEDRRQYEPEWYLNLAFYIGQQYAIWDRGLQSIREPAAPSWKVRYVANRIMPLIRLLMGKINRGTHIGQAVPIQQTETAFSDARMAERVLRALHDSLCLTDVYHEFFLWLFCTGTAFFKVYWDPTIGQVVNLPDGTSMPIGEVAVDVLGPFDLLVPTDIKAPLGRLPFRWMQIASYDIEVVRTTYPETARGLVPDDKSEESTYFERVKSLMTPLTGSYGRQQPKKGSQVQLLEMNEDPELLSEEDRQVFPNGRVTVMALQKRVILSQHVNPYISPYPSGSKNRLVMCRDDVMPGRFWGMSRISQLAPIQTNHNRGRSQIIEARDLATKPKILLEKNHGIAKITNMPGEILERNQGTAEPKFMNPPVGSDFLWRDILENKDEFNEIGQVSPASRGMAEQANLSGIALDMLQEADNTPLGPLATNVAQCFSRAQTLIYATAHQFYDEARTLSYVGEDEQDDVFVYTRDKHPTALRMQVSAQEVFPETKASRRVKAKEAIELQILQPGKDRAQLLRYLDFGDVQSALDNSDRNRQRANWENRQMLSGIPAVVETFDDHEIHLYQHNALRLSPEWLRMPPEIKAIINQHADQHLALMSQAVMAVAQMGGSPDPMNPGGEPDASGIPNPGQPPKGQAPEGA